MIVGIGANVYDTLITLPSFPQEDTKLRASSVVISGGGPCATGLCAASVLGSNCAYIGVLTDDSCGHFLLDDMKMRGCDNSFISLVSGYRAFTSCIWLNNQKATRTCVFDKGNAPMLKLNESQKNAIRQASILMVDGNELEAAIDGATVAKASNTKVLYDAGGRYDGIENLLPLADILIPSAEFATGHTKKDSIEQAAIALFEKYSPEVVVVTNGKEGGVFYDGKELFFYPAFEVDAVDTNGAGDVFHGAFAFAVEKGYSYKQCCIISSAVSAIKCQGIGARDSVPNFEKVKSFLKERGYNV